MTSGRGARSASTRLWLLAFIGFSLLHAAWAFAAPYNGPPDELQHALRGAGVVRGEIVAERDPMRDWHTVPGSLIRGWCFPTKVEVPASCDAEPGGDRTEERTQTTAGRFNPVYYLAVAWPLALWPDWSGILLSRLLNGAAMAALLACAVVVAARRTRHRALLAGLVVAITPMTAHLGGSMNPNGVEIAAGVALFVALIALVHEQREGVDRAVVALAGVSAGALVLPRFTGVLWLGVILGAVLIPSSRARLGELVRSRAVRVWSAVVAVSTLASLAWTVLVRSADPVLGDRGMTRNEILRMAIIDHVWPNMAYQMVGVTGWAETLQPRLIYVAWFMAVGLLVLGGLALGGLADRWRLLALFAATFAPLLLLEILTANQIGWFNQGRYFLAGAVGLPLLGAYVLARRGLTAPQLRSVTRLLAALLLPIHLVCLAYTMARWQSGLTSLNPLAGSWHPHHGPVLPLVLGPLAIAVLFLTYWLASREVAQAPPTDLRPAADHQPATATAPAPAAPAETGASAAETAAAEKVSAGHA